MPDNDEAHESDPYTIDNDLVFPAYVLLDEDNYDDIVESIQMSSLAHMPSLNNGDGAGGIGSRNPSRPASPSSGGIEELMERIDDLIGVNLSNLSHLPTLSSNSQKHGNLIRLVNDKFPTDGGRGEVLNLLTSSDQSQSKWSHPNRIGQAELYSSLEKVLLELKSFTPYSIPFSTRVNRKEVPDYYDVIKRPMDLGSMARKLKSLVYNNKREFQADLSRIYNNCFTYNTDPNSMLRLHVGMLKEKWTRLMVEVPDIEIQIIQTATSTPSDAMMQSCTSLDDSSQSFSSSHVSSASQIISNPNHNARRYDSLEIEIDPSPNSDNQPSTTLVVQRSSPKMGLFHKVRLKQAKYSKRKSSNKDPFFPELIFQNQIIPESISITMKQPDTSSTDTYDLIKENFELWRSLRFPDGADPLSFQYPMFGSDSKLFVERNVKTLTALLLTNVGFESAKSDALTLLQDLLMYKIEGIAGQLRKRFSRPSTISPIRACLEALFPFDAGRSCSKLALYQAHFIHGRRQRLRDVKARIEEWQASRISEDYEPDNAGEPYAGNEEDEDLSTVELDEDDLQDPSSMSMDLLGLKEFTTLGTSDLSTQPPKTTADDILGLYKMPLLGDPAVPKQLPRH